MLDWSGKSDYSGRVVLLTGDTGFKGSWLAHWLLSCGAKVVGVGLDPNTSPSLFDSLGLEGRLAHHHLDIRDEAALVKLVLDVKPDYVFHLAAQPLVRRSYANPVETYSINVMGTVHLLSALRELSSLYRKQGRYCAAVMITSDKCYENRDWVYAYREIDALGGKDPYSASKAAAEIVISSFRSAYFNADAGAPVIGVASVRAGNVIGGGDWAENRLVPDCMRSLAAGEPIPVRNASSTRPWQHVLEPLHGYLMLGADILRTLEDGDLSHVRSLLEPFNFGPDSSVHRSVLQLVEEVLRHWPGSWKHEMQPTAYAETGRLALSSDKAIDVLNWRPVWSFTETVARTTAWYRQYLLMNTLVRDLVDNDISAYCRDWSASQAILRRL